MEFIPNQIKRQIPTEVKGIGKLRPYVEPGKRRSKYISGQVPPPSGKLVPSLRDAIEQVGLKDGMTISFHHHLRNGDLVLPQVMAEIAAMGASCCDNMGNINGCLGKSAFGSMGYAKVDARFAKKVVAITDDLVPYPASPISIPQTMVDCVVQVERIGDPQLISQGATRKTKNPIELAIAEYASQVIIATGLVRNGFSYQAGSGGISLAVARYLKAYIKEHQIKGSFASGGITSTMTELLEEGYFDALLDVQTFDADAVASIRDNPRHIEMDAEMYADPQAKGNVANALDVMILSATEVDTNFNVNVLTASDGVIMGALGGHPDTAAGANLAIVVAPLIRKRVPIVVDRVVTISTPGESVDVVVTERGIAVNPQNPKLKARLIEQGLPVYEIEELRDMAYDLTGKPETQRTLKR